MEIGGGSGGDFDFNVDVDPVNGGDFELQCTGKSAADDCNASVERRVVKDDDIPREDWEHVPGMTSQNLMKLICDSQDNLSRSSRRDDCCSD